MSFIRILTEYGTEVVLNAEKLVSVKKSLITSRPTDYDFDMGDKQFTGELLGGSGTPIKSNENMIKVLKYLNKEER